MALLLFLTPRVELNNFCVLLTRECVVNITLYWAFTHFVQLPLSQKKKINQPYAVMKMYRASRVHVTEGHQMTDQTHNTAKNSHYNRRSGMKVLQN